MRPGCHFCEASAPFHEVELKRVHWLFCPDLPRLRPCLPAGCGDFGAFVRRWSEGVLSVLSGERVYLCFSWLKGVPGGLRLF